MPKHKTFRIGDECFSTQKNLVERCQFIKNNNLNQDICETKDVTFLTNLLSRHPNSLGKVGAGIKKFSVRRNGHGHDFCFWVTRMDETCEDFSFFSCIVPKSKDNIQNDAFRNEIRPQIEEFRELCADWNSCPMCRLEKRLFHVDHYTPQFQEIVSHFKLLNPNSNLDTMKNEMDQVAFTDRQVARNWMDHHKLFAVLRKICSDCNLARPKTNKRIKYSHD